MLEYNIQKKKKTLKKGNLDWFHFNIHSENELIVHSFISSLSIWIQFNYNAVMLSFVMLSELIGLVQGLDIFIEEFSEIATKKINKKYIL